MGQGDEHRSRRIRRAPAGADASNLTRGYGAHAGPLTGVRYSSSGFQAAQVQPSQVGAWLRPPEIAWLDVPAPSPDALLILQQQLGLHPLAVSDAAHPPQRPHHAAWPQFELLVITAAAPEGRLQQLSLFLGDHWVLSLRELPEDLFAPVRQRLEGDIGPLRRGSAALLVTALVSTVIDGLFERAEEVRERIEDLEEEITDDPRLLNRRLHSLRRQLLQLRRAVEPMRETVRRASEWTTQRWDPDAQVHLREAGEDTEQLFELLVDAQSTATALTDLNLSNQGGQTNSVLTLLTMVSTLFLPMTFLASLWGMNFHHMPELRWHWGYPVALGVIVLSAVLPFRWMLRQRWFRTMWGQWKEERRRSP